MSKQRRGKPDPVPASGGSWVLGADGKLVPNPAEENTRPNPGKTALAAEATQKRARGPVGESQADSSATTGNGQEG